MKSSVVLVGGLGNQLFGWAFSKFLEREIERRTQLLTFARASSSFNHGSHLEQLALENLDLRGRAGLHSLRLRAGLIAKESRGLDGVKRSHMLRVTSFEELGYPAHYNFDQDRPGHMYRGYFQTYRFIEAGVPDHQELQGMFRILGGQPSSSLAVHIRQGDYLLHSETLGVLDIDYYANAIQVQLDSSETRRLDFFGTQDQSSCNLVAALSKRFHSQEVRFLSLENPLAPSLDLRRIASYGRQVLSNSSFSWWGAYLAGPGLKVAPKKWFREVKDPDSLKPSVWQCWPSSWQ